MDKIFYLGVGVVSIGLVYSYGKRKVTEYIMGQVLNELNARMEGEEQFRPVHSNSAVIKVTSGGKTHSIYVPCDKKKSTLMLRRKVYLIKDGEKIDISQKPGVPYLVCAKDLGGEKIIVENLEGEVTQQFTEDQIPVLR